MNDRSISACHTVAAVLWVLALALVLVGSLTFLPLESVGLLVAGGAITLNVRGYLARLEASTRNLFELGRDLGRSEMREVRSLH